MVRTACRYVVVQRVYRGSLCSSVVRNKHNRRLDARNEAIEILAGSLTSSVRARLSSLIGWVVWRECTAGLLARRFCIRFVRKFRYLARHLLFKHQNRQSLRKSIKQDRPVGCRGQERPFLGSVPTRRSESAAGDGKTIQSSPCRLTPVRQAEGPWNPSSSKFTCARGSSPCRKSSR